jgi:hypothetical protein
MGAVGDHLLFAALWASFGLVHSVLAGRRAKAALTPLLGGYYRAVYNVVAATHLGVIFWVEWRFFPDRAVFDYPAWLTWLLYVAQAGGWFVVALGLFQYDLGRFAGLTQARAAIRRYELARQGVADDTVADPEPAAGPDEPLRTGGPHRYVRHPLYAGLFVVLWTRVFDEFTLATAVWGSLYLLIGTHYEERKLLRDHGDAYRRYRAAVPAYIPWRGRVWQD